MNMNRIRKLMNNPEMLYYFLMSRGYRSNLMESYSRKTGANGVTGIRFILTFDCDARQDFNHVLPMYQRLRDAGINAAFAVPGELLLEGAQHYEKLQAAGAEFINHGYRNHSERDSRGRYGSIFDYSSLGAEALQEDIEKGDESIRRTLGIRVSGFRAPHFGKLQAEHQLRLIHKICSSLGYTYSSSTTPFYAFKYGGIFNRFGLLEIPVSGLATEPLRIFDSFLFYDNDKCRFNSEEYFREGQVMAEMYEDMKVRDANAVINLYADPSQVVNSERFYDAMALFSSFSRNCTLSELASDLKSPEQSPAV